LLKFKPRSSLNLTIRRSRVPCLLAAPLLEWVGDWVGQLFAKVLSFGDGCDVISMDVVIDAARVLATPGEQKRYLSFSTYV
jgi:hypothetical protein